MIWSNNVNMLQFRLILCDTGSRSSDEARSTSL